MEASMHRTRPTFFQIKKKKFGADDEAKKKKENVISAANETEILA